MFKGMPASIWWANSPKLNESHLLACIGSLEQVNLGREQGVDIYAMPSKYDLGGELIGLWRFGGRSGWLLRCNMCRVVVVLRDRVRILLLLDRLGLLHWSYIDLILKVEVLLEKSNKLVLSGHGRRTLEADSR